VQDDLITWMMGRIPWSIDWRVLAGAGIILLVCGALGVFHARALDAMCLGELEARSIGVHVDGVRWGLLVGGGILAAIAVVIAGPIAFVGLVAPHVARRLVGAPHRSLVLGSIATGAAMLLFAESVRQIIDLGGGRLPIGVLTALVGGPAFLILLLRGGRSG
jgi:iron complex transport system permease protein